MAKNKGGKKNPKPDKTFIVKNMKKTKTKAVTTNLKKLNVQAKADNAKLKEKTDQANERFAAIQENVKQVSAKELTKKSVPSKQKSHDRPSTSVDMEAAVAEFAKL